MNKNKRYCTFSNQKHAADEMCGFDAPSFFLSIVPSSSARSFTVERKNNVFLKNGEPFRYISGSSDYFLLEGQTGVDEGSWSECFDNVSGNAFFLTDYECRFKTTGAWTQTILMLEMFPCCKKRKCKQLTFCFNFHFLCYATTLKVLLTLEPSVQQGDTLFNCLLVSN